MGPRLVLGNRQRAVRFSIDLLREAGARAVILCLARKGARSGVLTELAEVEATFVSDRVIARVHGQFLKDPAPTDVITFEHGEIVISAETAARQAAALGEPLERELIRYLVHGLLHLNGHEDGEPEEAAAMWSAQEAVVAELASCFGKGRLSPVFVRSSNPARGNVRASPSQG